ncbi:Cof-type HAD-IIB family hydrolase [Ferdinandcohnia quinoae]|uniref:Cof-type HAD-IIB family hydrolase n=1 Tax=Fredinandcohnia quinoae TaxID=2918902 RepID=A0AAW5EAQ3_9BACI|nr:Cof-type HAD-IIB family hydrolase [Fredinandcohnia sp. SECRCQ15]MCH1627096.1 Cof-type HAD-IIB family hydrolase [Fredinandcohnia sp. SECRCQ15]
MYRLLAINIDGTLLRPNGRLQAGTKEAIDFVRNKGVYVTLVTRRNFPSAKKIAKALKLDSLLITHNGAFVSSTLEEPMFERRISEEKTFNIVQVLENYKCNIRLLHEKFSIGNRMKFPGNLMAKAVFGSGDPLFYPMQFVDSLGDSLRDNPVAPPKIEVFCQNESELRHVEDTLKDHFEGIRIEAVDGKKLEIVPVGVSKLNGLRALAYHLDIPLQKTVAIGDSPDDIEMIAAAGLGVAMWNAPKEVKFAADWVTRSNNMNGVSYMIKEHFRKQQRIEFLKQIKIEK